jgi:hypothetical protein
VYLLVARKATINDYMPEPKDQAKVLQNILNSQFSSHD